MEPQWLAPEAALKEFGRFETDPQMLEMWRGLYRREYTALMEIFKNGVG